LHDLGTLLAATDAMDDAHRAETESRALYTELQDADSLLLGDITLAREELAAGKASAAVERLQHGIAAAPELSQPTKALAQGALALALATAGRADEARKALAAAEPLAGKLDGLERLELARDRAVTLSATKHTAEALADAQAALDDARKLGFVPAAFEARIALAQIELAAGKRDDAKTRLAALADDAKAAGFIAVARRAHDLTP
jgi:hypothetical protein